MTTRTPEVPYPTGTERDDWIAGIADWKARHPEYADYVLRTGFGGPSRNEQDAKRRAEQDAYRQFGGALDESQITTLEIQTIQKITGDRYYWYADVYVGYDNSGNNLRSILINERSRLSASLPKLRRWNTGLTAIGWPALVAGIASSGLAAVSFVLGNDAKKEYDDAPTSPDATDVRRRVELWSYVFSVSAGGAAGVPLGSVLLLLRSNIEQVQADIETLLEAINSLPETEGAS